jgi:hypothetical protein
MIVKNTSWRWIKALLVLISLCSSVSFASPVIEQLGHRGVWLTLNGHGFGASCERCEVIADYGSLRYALVVNHWSDRRIEVMLPDLNLATRVWLQVVTDEGKSNREQTQIVRRVVPATELTQPRQPPPSDLLTLSKRSDLKVGASGEEQLDVSSAPPACGKEAMLFDHARVVFAKRRFGDAQIVTLPKPGCTQCDPLSVRWYHEPTGHIDFQVHVYRRRVAGICTERRR